MCVSHVCAPVSTWKPAIKLRCCSSGANLFVFLRQAASLVLEIPDERGRLASQPLSLPVSTSPELGKKLVPLGLVFCFCLFLCLFLCWSGEMNSSLHWLSHHPRPMRVTFGSWSQLSPIPMPTSGVHCGGRTWIHCTPASASPVRRSCVCIPQLALGNFHFQVFNLKPCGKLGFIAIKA